MTSTSASVAIASDRQVLFGDEILPLSEAISRLRQNPDERSRFESSRTHLESQLSEAISRLRERGVSIDDPDPRGDGFEYDIADVAVLNTEPTEILDKSGIDRITSHLRYVAPIVGDLAVASALHLLLADIYHFDYFLESDGGSSHSAHERLNPRQRRLFNAVMCQFELHSSFDAVMSSIKLGEILLSSLPLDYVFNRRGLESLLRTSYDQAIRGIAEGYYDFLDFTDPRVLGFMEGGRARELTDVLDRRKYLEGTPELLRRFAKLEASREADAALRALEQGSAEILWSRGLSSFESGMAGAAPDRPAERDAAIANLSALQRDFFAELGGQAQFWALADAVKSSLKTAGYKPVSSLPVLDPVAFARRLPDRSLVLSYYCYNLAKFGLSGCVLLALHPSGQVRLHRLSAPPKYIAAAVQFVAQALARGARLNDQALTGRLAWTADVLLGPVADWLRDANHLAIVPDAALFGLPFAALPVPGGRALLIENLDVRIWPSLQFAAKAASRSSSSDVTSSPVVLGISSFNTLPPLTYAEDEAREVARLLGGPPLIGPEATADALMERSASAGVIHIASHGKFEVLAPMSSWIALKSPDGRDKRFTAAEILGMLLDAKVVTLSACDTANPYGWGVTYAGDPLGLPRAFLGAGAETVVASLWKVDDSATAQLMNSFYQGLVAGALPAQSLRTAQLQFAKAGRPPRLWAPFTVITGTW